MTIHFYLRFRTRVGQHLSISGPFSADGAETVVPMQYANDDFWKATVELDGADIPVLRYQYIFSTDAGDRIKEGERHRRLELQKKSDAAIATIDTWNDQSFFENAFYTAPFKDVFFSKQGKEKIKKPSSFTHIFKIKAPLLQEHEMMCLLGEGEALRNWNTADAVLMAREGEWWVQQVDLSKEAFPLAYKYGIYNSKKETFVQFEKGPNRSLPHFADAEEYTVVHDGFVRLPANTWKGSGVAIPVFSLRSEKSAGIGEFTDLKLLADWAARTGLKLIQILPVNDTTATKTWRDSYPYAAISAFALHPVYINLNKVAGKGHAKAIQAYLKKAKGLNSLPYVDYEAVMQLKMEALEHLYAQHAKAFLEEKEYTGFFEENRHWLVPYAAFCYLRDKYGTTDYSTWKNYNTYNHFEIEKLVAPKSKSFKKIAFYFFIQYHLHLQLKEAVAYAHKQGVALKGDIPIGVFRNGSDTWTAPDLYNMDQQAGAPPDDFAVKGQNWGFPTYNWHRMQENDFEWWRKRFRQMSYYFDAFRIDHILGFFRIWSIPEAAVEGILGRFVPALPVAITEFEARGISFDYERFCKPYITDAILEKIFGSDVERVKQTFSKPHAEVEGRYELQEQFDTQKKIETYFATQQEDGELKKLQTGLFDLLSNVILFEEPGSNGTAFHFRISVESTPSFQQLDDHTKQQLHALYLDYFYYRQDLFWKEEALRKLPALKESTDMLICGEDLGMVPHCVPEVMQRLGILSLEIQRMPKNIHTEFFQPKDAPYLSVITPSTHDMSTVRAWWEEDRARTQRFYNFVLGQWGEAPPSCEAWISRAIVLQHLYAPAMWAIFQLQDLLGMSEELRRDNPQDERINVPAIAQHYWRYRMHLTLEQLLKEDSFNDELHDYIKNSGR